MKEQNRKPRKKKKGSNLFIRYFTISSMTVFVSFVFIALVMIFFIAAQWWTDKVDILSKNAHDIVSVYTYLDTDNELDEELITGTLKIMSAATQSEYFITDANGDAFYCGDCESGQSSSCDNHKDLVVDKATLLRAIDGGFSDYMTDDDFGIGRFVVAVPVRSEAGEVRCIVFAVEDAITGLIPYVASIATAFSYSDFPTLL